MFEQEGVHMVVPLIVLCQLPGGQVSCTHSLQEGIDENADAILFTAPVFMQKNMRHIEHWVCMVRHRPS